MMWHFLEIWLAVLTSFCAGSLIGALVYVGLGRTPLADLQGGLADRVGDMIDNVKTRFGAGPVWRPVVRRRFASASHRPRAASSRSRASARPLREEAWIDFRRGRGASDLPHDEQLIAAAEAAFEEAVEGEAIVPMRPMGLTAPRNGVPDDLQRIRGIGRRNEQLLNSLGIFHFGQIAAWTPAETRWIGAYLAFPERIERDDWVGQAVILASGGDTGYIKSERRRAQDEEDADPA